MAMWDLLIYSSVGIATSQSLVQQHLGKEGRGIELYVQDYKGWHLLTTLAMGTPPQNLTAKVSTSWADIFVPSVNCTESWLCNQHHLFNLSRSDSFRAVGREVKVHEYGIFYTRGVAALDDLHVGDLTICQQEFELADLIHESYFMDGWAYDSPLGLARRTVFQYPRNSNLFARSAFENIISQNLLENNLFAIRWPEYNSSTNGQLTLGYIDHSSYSGELIQLPIVDVKSTIGEISNPSYGRQIRVRNELIHDPFQRTDAHAWTEDEQEDDYLFYSGGWQVEITSITVGSGPDAFRVDLPGYIAAIISDTPFIELHPSIYHAVADRINGGIMALLCEDIGPLPDLTFSLVGRGGRSHDFTLFAEDYASPWLPIQLTPPIFPGPGYCWAPIIRIPDNGTVPPYIVLGSQFLRAFYSVFDTDDFSISCKYLFDHVFLEEGS